MGLFDEFRCLVGVILAKNFHFNCCRIANNRILVGQVVQRRLVNCEAIQVALSQIIITHVDTAK